MNLHMGDYRIWEVDITATFENTCRNEFGWVQGFEPGNGKYLPPETKTLRIIALRQEQATERALQWYKHSGAKDVKIVDIRKLTIDAIILELC